MSTSALPVPAAARPACAPPPRHGCCCTSGCGSTSSPPPTSPTSGTTAATGVLTVTCTVGLVSCRRGRVLPAGESVKFDVLPLEPS